MSDSTFVILCLAGVFGLIAIVGGFLSLLMLHGARAKAWKNKAALAKATGAPIPVRPRPVALAAFCILVLAAIAGGSAWFLWPAIEPLTPKAPLPAASPKSVPPVPATPSTLPSSPAK